MKAEHEKINISWMIGQFDGCCAYKGNNALTNSPTAADAKKIFKCLNQKTKKKKRENKL